MFGKRIEFGEKQDDEVSVWSVAVGNLPLFPSKKVRQAVDFIKEQDGFIGFHPVYPYGTLCLFRTENDAKGAKNMMRFKGIQVGNNICEVYINEQYLDQRQSKRDKKIKNLTFDELLREITKHEE